MKNELFIMEKVKNPFAVKLYMHFLVNEVPKCSFKKLLKYPN